MALLVFISHFGIELPYDIDFVIGRIGVVGFMMIAGYLGIRSRMTKTAANYMIGRLIRLYPVYWILISIMACLDIKNVTVRQFLCNLTLFQEYLGEENIIGASWMLSIMIFLYVFIAVRGKALMDVAVLKVSRLEIWEVIFAVIAICSGMLRYYTSKAFPTAIPLLMMVGLLGILLSMVNEKGQILRFIVVFEISLIVSTYFSYSEYVQYIVAYNLGILLFCMCRHFEPTSTVFEHLGEISFSFFLMPDIALAIMSKFISVDDLVLSRKVIIGITKFVLSIILAELSTRFLERPISRKIKIIMEMLC